MKDPEVKEQVVLDLFFSRRSLAEYHASQEGLSGNESIKYIYDEICAFLYNAPFAFRMLVNQQFPSKLKDYVDFSGSLNEALINFAEELEALYDFFSKLEPAQIIVFFSYPNPKTISEFKALLLKSTEV
jgi:hypothetical protein